MQKELSICFNSVGFNIRFDRCIRLIKRAHSKTIEFLDQRPKEFTVIFRPELALAAG